MLVLAILCLWVEEGMALLSPAHGILRQLEAGRSVLPRLSTSQPHRACTTSFTKPSTWLAMSCIEPSSPADPDSRKVALWGRLRAQLSRLAEPPAESYRALGRYLLVHQDKIERLDRAVDLYEKALNLHPDDPALLSESAATLLTRAQSLRQPLDLMKALANVDLALRIDPHDLPALFNRALVFEAFHLHHEARRAWNRYLRRDPTTAWADEARRRLSSLRQPAGHPFRPAFRGALLDRAAAGDRPGLESIVASEAQKTRELGEELLGAWAHDEADALQLAEIVGQTLATQHGSHLVSRSVEAVQLAQGSEREELKTGHRNLDLGIEQLRRFELREAEESLMIAEAALSRAHSPMAWRAKIERARLWHHRDEEERALALLEEVGTALEGEPYPALRCEVDLLRGLIRLILGQPAAAVLFYRQALDTANRLQEKDRVLALHALLAEALADLGRPDQAWRHHLAALALSIDADSSALLIVYPTAADAALALGEPELALYFQDEAVRRAERLGDALLTAETYLWRALIRGQLGHSAAALSDLAAAKRLGTAAGDDEVRQRTLADLSLIEGRIRRQLGEPRAATPFLDTAIDYFRTNRQTYLSVVGLRSLAGCYRDLGESERAAAVLRGALEIYESIDRSITADEYRLTFVEESRDIYSEMIELLGDAPTGADEAFDIVEKARTRSLPPEILFSTGGRQALNPTSEVRTLAAAEVRARLPENTAMIHYAHLRGGLRIWLTWNGRTEVIDRVAVPTRIEDLTAKLRQAADEPAEGLWAEASVELYDQLVGPWIHRLPVNTRLVFVRDRGLHAIPFAGLIERSSKRYLIQDHPVVIAPSASFYLRARRTTAAAPRRALVVGNPAFDRRVYEYLQYLPAASEEARRVATHHSDSLLLLEEQATKTALLAALPAATLLHFAGHAVTHAGNPLLSHLVLTPEASLDGALYAHEIYGLQLQAGATVVLSACDTAVQPGLSSATTTGLARAFLAAGASTIVASLRAVPDQATAALFEEFYAARVDGVDPALALRRAQIALAGSTDPALRHPAHWSAFEVIVANATSHP